ncbi:hypothetical protein [Sphingomonas radiodurans]|uniref:hypothetical protein n=1 Tax=Sphingomonas radiodurans TaxID=2890321 RepID=UPI001E40FD36|nr:hypothetical protein [Sphingomonas radiodurans]WBH15855.1 hypothetical protein LLW23_13720 [Sphingomonas radiodurans]
MVAYVPRNLNEHHVENPLFGKVYQSAITLTAWNGWIEVDGVEVDIHILLPSDTVNEMRTMKPIVLALCERAEPMIRTILERRDQYRTEVATQAAFFVQDWLEDEDPVSPETIAERLTLTSFAIDADGYDNGPPNTSFLGLDFILADQHPISVRVDVDESLNITNVEAG